MLSYRITNDIHDELDAMLRRMMVLWSTYCLQPGYSQLANPHIPKAFTTQGLMDIIALGTLLELSQVLDRRSYYTDEGIHWQEQHEIALARQHYRYFQSWFSEHYETRVGGKTITAISIFRRCLVEFAAAIIVYKETQSAEPQILKSLQKCTASAVQEKVMSLFKSNFPEVCACLQELVARKAAFFYWTGPPITIRPMDSDAVTTNLKPKLADFEDLPIYAEYYGDRKGKGKGKERAKVGAPANGTGHPPPANLDGQPTPQPECIQAGEPKNVQTGEPLFLCSLPGSHCVCLQIPGPVTLSSRLWKMWLWHVLKGRAADGRKTLNERSPLLTLLTMTWLVIHPLWMQQKALPRRHLLSQIHLLSPIHRHPQVHHHLHPVSAVRPASIRSPFPVRISMYFTLLQTDREYSLDDRCT
jgi:hypothetical protein